VLAVEAAVLQPLAVETGAGAGDGSNQRLAVVVLCRLRVGHGSIRRDC
jgi:hypothetical protein